MLGWAGRGWWAGPETATLGLLLAWAWREAAGELCVGTSWGCLPATPSSGELWTDWLTWVLLSHGGRAPEDKEGSRGAQTSWGPKASPRDRTFSC